MQKLKALFKKWFNIYHTKTGRKDFQERLRSIDERQEQAMRNIKDSFATMNGDAHWWTLHCNYKKGGHSQ